MRRRFLAERAVRLEIVAETRRSVIFLATSAASALPTVSHNSLSVSKADPMVQVVRRNRPHSHRHSHRHSRSGDGIRPLVGSGDY